ncbi:alpha/beta fold hydrolase [Tabrizicola sp. J26]|nr:alpha/beta fold hydrolase [Tabrizicola rongguiensis]
MAPDEIPANWPFRDVSRFVRCGTHRWHVQELGAGPELLLLHGAGASTHSFRHLVPLLQRSYRVIAVDLPGQGFTSLGARNRCGLDDIASDLADLIVQEGWSPFAFIGHSAGAAVALRLAELRPVQAVIGINAALGQFEGLAGWLFPRMAQLLSVLPLVPEIFSRIAGTPQQVHRLLASTGSRIDAEGEAQYLALVRRPSHVAATLAMMAQWNLDELIDRLGQIHVPCLLITGSADTAVPASTSEQAAKTMPEAIWVDLPRYGHLVHEEAADKVAALILDFLSQHTKDTG